MILSGRTISKGRAEGKVLKLEGALSFLGGVDASTGEVKVEKGGNVADKILVFPRGKGSTVGSFVMYDLKVHGKAPAAVINSSAETIVATGAVISSIPMVDSVDVNLINDGDDVIVDADAGTVEIKGAELKESASSVVLINGKILMLKRPDDSHSYPGRWSLCAGKLEKGEKPEQAAVREILEETGIRDPRFIGGLPPVMVREDKVIWKVYPFIFDAGDAKPVLNDENDDYRLVMLDEMDSLYLVEKTKDVVTELLKMV